MKRNMSTMSVALLTIVAIALIAQLTIEQSADSPFGMASVVVLIFVLSYLLARLYQRYK